MTKPPFSPEDLLGSDQPILTLLSKRLDAVPEQSRLLIVRDLDQGIIDGHVTAFPAGGDLATVKLMDETGRMTERKVEDLWLTITDASEAWIKNKVEECLYYLLSTTGKLRLSPAEREQFTFDPARASQAFHAYKKRQRKAPATTKTGSDTATPSKAKTQASTSAANTKARATKPTKSPAAAPKADPTPGAPATPDDTAAASEVAPTPDASTAPENTDTDT